MKQTKQQQQQKELRVKFWFHLSKLVYCSKFPLTSKEIKSVEWDTFSISKKEALGFSYKRKKELRQIPSQSSLFALQCLNSRTTHSQPFSLYPWIYHH